MEPNSSAAAMRLAGPVELFSSAWNLFKIHWQKLVAIVIVPSAMTLVAQLFFLSKNPILVFLGVILAISGFIFSLAMQVALIDAINQLSISSSANVRIKGQYKRGFSLFWSVIFLIIIQGLVLIGATILLIIPGIVVGIYASVCVYALVLDDKRGFSALTESFSLIKQRWWGVLWRVVFITFVTIVAYAILASVALGLNFILGFVANSAGANAVSAVFSTALALLIGPLTSAYVFKMYQSLRATRVLNTTVSAFKNWLVAFLCLGVLGLILIPIIGTTALAAWAVAHSNLRFDVQHTPLNGTLIRGATGSDYYPNGTPGSTPTGGNP